MISILLAFATGLACGAILRRPTYIHNHSYLVVRKVNLEDEEEDADWWKDGRNE